MAGAAQTATIAVVTGGGTAGHVLPALAIAEGLIAAGVERTAVHYVGTVHGAERALVPPTGLAATYLDISGLQRALSRRNLALPGRVLRSVRAAVGLLRGLRPRVVINVGGYASFPATFAARWLRIPYVIVSYDLRPGLVSRLLARRAALVAVAFPATPLPRAELVGAPVRAELVALDRGVARGPARAALGLPADRAVILVAGGSHGSQILNRTVDGLVAQWAGRADLAVVHIVGERNLGSAGAERDGSDGILYRVLGFTTDIVAMYAAADVMVCRAGAGTVAELTTVGIPSIVVPWAGSAENHQAENAAALAAQHAAVVVGERGLSTARLCRELDALLGDDEARAALAARARAAGEVHRSGRLVARVLEVAGVAPPAPREGVTPS